MFGPALYRLLHRAPPPAPPADMPAAAEPHPKLIMPDEMPELAFKSLMDAAIAARETGKPQIASVQLMGCRITLQATEWP